MRRITPVIESTPPLPPVTPDPLASYAIETRHSDRAAWTTSPLRFETLRGATAYANEVRGDDPRLEVRVVPVPR